MNRETQMQELLSRLLANPYNLGPLKQLERLYRTEIGALITIFHEQAQLGGGADSAARLLLEAGRLTALRLGDRDAGLEYIAAALDVGENTLVSVEAHLFNLALRGEDTALIEYFTEALEHAGDAGDQSRLYLRMGTILGEILQDVDQAGDAFGYALELDPTNVAARWAHQDLARAHEDWTTLAGLLYVEVENSESAVDQAVASVALGRIYRDQLGDADGAAQCFEMAAALDPENADARAELAGEVADVEPAAFDNPGTVELDEAMMLEEVPAQSQPPAFEDSDAYDDDLADESSAAEDIAAIVAESQGDPGTLELDEMLELEEDLDEGFDDDFEEDEEIVSAGPPAIPGEHAADETEAYEHSEVSEISEFSEVGESEVEEEAEVSEADEVFEADSESEAVEVFEADAESEVSEADDAVVSAPTSSSWRERFEKLVAAANDSADAPTALCDLVGAERLESRHRQGDADGLALWESAALLGIASEFYRHTSYAWQGAGFWQPVFDLVEDDAVKARIAFFKLHNYDEARTLAEASGDAITLAGLEDLDLANENWRKFQRAAEERFEGLGEDEKTFESYWYMADMAEMLEDLNKEVDALRRLERNADSSLVNDRSKRLYKRDEKWPKYAEMLKREIDQLGDDQKAEKIDLIHESIVIYRDKLQRDTNVENAYKDILDLEPDNFEAIDALIEYYESKARFPKLVKMLQDKAELVSDDDARVDLYEKIAKIFVDEFRNQAEAITAYESILELRPHHPGAIAFLKDSYEKRRDWEKLIEVHKQEIETFEADAEKAEGFRQVAELAADKLRNPEVATELWLEVRRFAPEDSGALDALETLYEKSRDYEKLAEVLENKVDYLESDDEKMKLFQKLGMLCSDRLEDPARAIAAWKNALALEREDLKARKALERLYIDNQDWDALEDFYADYDAHQDLVRVLETLAGTVKDDPTKIELLLRAARIWRDVLEDTGRAERDLERVLEADPRNENAALQLEPIAREKQDFAQLKTCYETILEHRDSADERREYQLKLAALHAEHLDDAPGAFRWYAEAFKDDPSAQDVIASLEEAAHKADVYEALSELYSNALQTELEDATRQHLRMRLGTVLSEQINDLDGALIQFNAVLEQEDDNLEALAALESIYRRAQRWDELMSVYRRRLGLTDSVSDKVGILQGMANIAEVQASDIDTAIERLREALELEPENEKTLVELHRLYASEHSYEELAGVIRREIEIIEGRAAVRKASRPAQVDVRTFLAGPAALADGGSQANGTEADAIVAEQVAEEDVAGSDFGDDLSESGLLDEASEAALDAISTADEVEETLAGEVVRGEKVYLESEIEQLVALRFELGEVCQNHLGEDAEALSALGLVLAWRPLHHAAARAIEAYLSADAYRNQAARDLAPVYAVQGKWNQLIDVLEIQVEQAEGAQKVELFERIARIQVEELAAHEKAFDTYARLLNLQPENELARTQLRRIAGPVERWEAFIDLLETQLPKIDSDELRIAYLFDLAETYFEHLGDSDTAQKLYHQVLEIREDSSRALSELEGLYADTEQWRALLDVYELELKLADMPTEYEALQFKMVVVWERLLDNPEQAIAVLRTMLEQRPNNLRALEMLGELYRGQEQWDALGDTLRAELELADEDAQNGVKNRLAALSHDHLGEVDQAVDLYEEVLQDEPTNAQALAALEQIMELDDAPASRVSRILEPLHIEQGDHEKLIRALDIQVAKNDDAGQRVALRHRVAELHAVQASRPHDAFDTYARALSDDVENAHTLENLYRLAEEQDLWRALATQFEREADIQPEPKTKSDLLWRAARIAIDPLNEAREASLLLRQVQQLFPDDLEAVEALEAQYRELADYEELVDILVAKAELVEAEQDKKNLLYQAATIFEDVLDRPADAVDVYRAVLAVDPADAHGIDRLEVIFTELERWNDLLDIYRIKLDLADNDESKKDLLYAMGPIHREHLDAPFEAVETYRAILEIDATELAAWEKLDELYAETAQWSELLETLESEIALVALDADKLDLRYRVGRLWELELGDTIRAIEVYRGVLAEDSTHQDSTAALEGLITRGEQEVEAGEVLQPIYEAAGEWEKLVHVYKLLIDASLDAERKLALYAEVARIYEQELQDPQNAFATHVSALSVDPARADVLENLERLARKMDAWEVLIEQLDDALYANPSPEATTELNLRIARIYEEELERSDLAIERFLAVVDAEPDNQTAVLALDRLYQREGQWENLAGVLTTRIYATTDPDEALELRLRLGLLHQEALDQPDDAIDVYQTVLLDQPDNIQAIQSLEQMFMSGQAVQRISDILEPHYLEKGQHEKLVEIYLQRLEMLTEHPQRHEILMQVGRLLLNELEDKPRALSAYGAALFEKPDDPEVLALLDELAQSTNAWPETAGFYVDTLGRPDLEPDDALALWLNLARVLDQKLHNTSEAENAYLQALEIDPSEPRALEALDRIYDDQGRHADLANILQRRIDGVYDEEAIVELSFRQATIYQNNLEDPRSAVDTYRKVLDVRPTHEDSLLRLERLHLEHQQWQDLFEILQRRVENTNEPVLKVELYSRMANLAEEMLGRPTEAIDLWNEILKIDPTDLDALSELQRLYLNEERYDDLVRVLEQQVELTENPREKLILHESLGVIWQDKIDNEIQAQDAWRNALAIDPMHLPALESLRGIYTRQADYTELAQMLGRLIQHEDVANERKLGLWIELAEVQGDMLMESQEAITAWKSVMAIEPGNELALENLERLYLQEGMWLEAAQVLEIKVDRTEDPLERTDILTQIADIWEHKLVEPNRAITFYQQILDIDPTNMQAGRALESIYTGQDDPGAFQGLVELYLTRAEMVDTDPFERTETLRNAARIFEQHLGQPENALLVLLSAYGPATLDDAQLGADLERLAEETHQWSELVERANAILGELPEGLDAAELRRKVGYWYADKLDQPDDAVYHLRRALGITPDSVEILEKLESLYQKLNAWPEMAEIIRKRIELTGMADEQINLWRRLGELSEMQMNDVDQAVDAYRQILAIDDTDILAMESLESLFEAFDRPQELIDILAQKCDSTYDPDAVVAIRVRIAEIYEQALQDPHSAIDAYREVLAVDQAHMPSLQALERLYLQTEQWNELLEVNEQTLGLTHDPEQQVAIYGKIAAINEEQFEDAEAAVEAYHNVLVAQPENVSATSNLQRLYRNNERWFDLAEVLARHAEFERVDSERVNLLNELARVRRDHLSDPHGAIEAFEQSVQLDPRQAGSFMELATLQEQTEAYEAAVGSYGRLVSLVGENTERAEIYARIGELLEHQLMDDARAEDGYLSALELMPGHSEAIGAMRRISGRKHDWQPFIRVLKLAEAASRDLNEKAGYLAEIGTLYERELDDQVSALNYYESALESNARTVAAAEPLIGMYIREQKWERAVPLLELVIEEANKADTPPEKLHHLYLQAGQTFMRLEMHERALDHYREAYELESNDFETLKGLGNLLFLRQDFQKAASVFDNLEYHHVDKLDQEEQVELYHRCGQIRRSFGENRSAIEYYTKALDIDGYDRAVLAELIELYEEQQNWEQVVEYSRRLLETENDPSVRLATLTRIGDMLTGQLGDLHRAVNVYNEALAIDDTSMLVLDKLLKLYTKAQQWIEAVDILNRLIALQTNPIQAAKLNYAVGVIFRDNIGDPAEAVKYFDAALDNNVRFFKAFEAIDRIATAAKEWKELERAYRRMLRRVSDNDDGSAELANVKTLLWSSLGEIYRTRLGHVKSAINAYETAISLNPSDTKMRLILAELYEKKADDPQGAAKQHKELIKLDPFRTESYRALFKAYIQGKEYDKAWCMSAALSYLKRANEQEEKFYRQYLGQNLPAARGQFKQDTYRLLYRKEQDMLVSFIMSIIGQGLRGYYSRKLKATWGVHPRKDKLDLDQQMPFCKIYKYVARTQALVPAPEVMLKRDAALGIRNANADVPTVIIGADMTQGKGDRELAFLIAKRLCWMRPEHYLGSVGYPTENLKLMFMSAMHMTNPNLGLDRQLGQPGADVIRELQAMPPQMISQMQKYMQQYLALQKNPDLSEWLTEVEHTSIRMGLVMCGDLHEAVSCISNDANPIGKATVKQRVQELVLFAISDEYFAIREALGLTIG